MESQDLSPAGTLRIGPESARIVRVPHNDLSL